MDFYIKYNFRFNKVLVSNGSSLVIKSDKNSCKKKKVVVTGSIGLVGSFLSEIRKL